MLVLLKQFIPRLNKQGHFVYYVYVLFIKTNSCYVSIEYNALYDIVFVRIFIFRSVYSTPGRWPSRAGRILSPRHGATHSVDLRSSQMERY